MRTPCSRGESIRPYSSPLPQNLSSSASLFHESGTNIQEIAEGIYGGIVALLPALCMDLFGARIAEGKSCVETAAWSMLPTCAGNQLDAH